MGLLDRAFSSDFLPAPVKSWLAIIREGYRSSTHSRGIECPQQDFDQEWSLAHRNSAVGSWGNNRGEGTVSVPQATVSGIVARAKQREEMGVAKSVLPAEATPYAFTAVTCHLDSHHWSAIWPFSETNPTAVTVLGRFIIGKLVRHRRRLSQALRDFSSNSQSFMHIHSCFATLIVSRKCSSYIHQKSRYKSTLMVISLQKRVLLERVTLCQKTGHAKGVGDYLQYPRYQEVCMNDLQWLYQCLVAVAVTVLEDLGRRYRLCESPKRGKERPFPCASWS